MSYYNNLKKLQPWQLKSLLNMMGIPVAEITTSKAEAVGLCEAYKRQNEDEFKKAYQIIVEHDMGAAKDFSKTMKLHDAARIVADEVKKIEVSALQTVSSKYVDLSDRLIDEITKEKNDFSEKAKRELDVISQYAKEAIDRESKKFNTVQIKVGTNPAKKATGTLPEEFPKLLQLAVSRKNILMVGPTGCGKTYIAHEIAKHLDLPFASQSCSAGVSESAFSGWLVPIGDRGKFVYVQSEFVRLYENGGVFLFDEIDASDANVLVFMNQALANGGFTISQRHEKPYVKKHKDFVAVAAANTNGGGADSLYHGRNALDEATLDRFRVGTVMMNYSKVVEESIIDESVLKWGREIRQAIEKHSLRRVMSTRTLLDAQEMVKVHGWSFEDIEAGYFASWSKEERVMVRNEVAAIQNRNLFS